MTIRNLGESDIDSLADHALLDWQETYEGFIPEAEIEEFVNEAYHPDRIEAMLPKVNGGEMGFWIAENEEGVQGWLQLADFGGGLEIGRSGFLDELATKPLLKAAEQFVKAKGGDKYFTYVDQDDRDHKVRLEVSGFKHIKKKDDGTDRYFEKRI